MKALITLIQLFCKFSKTCACAVFDSNDVI